MSVKQKIILAPGFSEKGSEHQSPYIDGSLAELPDLPVAVPASSEEKFREYTTFDYDRDYGLRGSMEDSWTRQIKQAGSVAINSGDEPIVTVAHSLSSGPALRAFTELKQENPDRDLGIILDSPVGTDGKTAVPKLVYSAAVKTFRNIIDSTRQPYGSNLGLEQDNDRSNRIKRVAKLIGVAGLQLVHVISTGKEIWYASRYDIHDDLQAAVEAGVDVHVLLNNKDDMENTNSPKRWRKKEGKKKAFRKRKQVPAVPKALADDNGELLAPVSTRSDKHASHDTQLYAPQYSDATYANITRRATD